MVSKVTTFAFQGLEVAPVEVQVHMASANLPSFTVVGLPDKSVKEARERVRAAINSLGLALPALRITVNLAPADLQKDGSHLDLPIALALLAYMDVIEPSMLESFVVVGEVALDGKILPVSGTLPAAIGAQGLGKGLICPKGNGHEAVFAGDLPILAPQTLLELINHFRGTQILSRPELKHQEIEWSYPDLADVRGQETAKRVLEIAAAGGHHMLMIGPPGSGKSMLAQRLPGILPPLTTEEMLEVSIIASVTGTLEGGKVIQRRPIRDPHHSCSMPALVGGGTKAKPGEITLAHHGILFLDELPEFSRQALDSLRQPLESRRVTVSRAEHHITYPANFQLVAAMNPCRCGYFDDPTRCCSKVPLCAADYQQRLSGPLLDRMDLVVEVPAIKPVTLENLPKAESSASVAARVAKARKIQQERFADQKKIKLNAHAEGQLLEQVAAPDAAGRSMLNAALERLGLSMRGYGRVLRVARTIADLDGADFVLSRHIAEALSYRLFDLRQANARIKQQVI